MSGAMKAMCVVGVCGVVAASWVAPSSGHALANAVNVSTGGTIEVVVPHRREERLQRIEAGAVGSVEASASAAAAPDEAGGLEDAEVLRDRRPGEVEVRCDVARRSLPVPHQSQNRAPSGAGDRFEPG